MNPVNSFYKNFLMFSAFFTLMLISGLSAEMVYVRMNTENYRYASLRLQNDLKLIAEEKGMSLYACESSLLPQIESAGLTFEKIEAYDHMTAEDLPPVPGGGIPMALVTDKGSQGDGGWHNGAAIAGNVIAYMETDIDGQLPRFTFLDMAKDSTWHHYIDTDLNGDQILYMASGEHVIYYTFHYWGVNNSAMRYYWYDTRTGEHGEIENFGYGFEAFACSDSWAVRIGSKGMGWNNQMYGHNIETGQRFELLADSTEGSWGYDYDNFGGVAIGGNTIVYAYTDNPSNVNYLKIYSLGADGIFGTADDIGAVLDQGAMYGHNGPFRIEGRYVVWQEGNDTDEGNIRAYDMGEDELYGTEDDAAVFDICTDAAKQANPRISDGIVIWEDWRDAGVSGVYGKHDIYGYDIENDTEFRSTANSDSLMLIDFKHDEVLMIKPDFDRGDHNDIYLMNITGRIISDYYSISISEAVNPIARSLLTGTSESAPHDFSFIRKGANGPLSALFIYSNMGSYHALAYSAVTGEWSTEDLPYSSNFSPLMENENAMILGRGVINDGDYRYSAWLYNGRTGVFAPRETMLRPDGFAVGKNISFIWGTDATTHWIRTYDAVRNDWYYQSAISNDPWHVIATEFSDSLGLLLHAEGDTICRNAGVMAYDLQLHDWSQLYPLYTINRYKWEETVQMAANARFAVVTHESDNTYYDYIYTYENGSDQWEVKRTPVSFNLDKPFLGTNFIVQGTRYNNTWQAYIYDGCNGDWIPGYIESQNEIDKLLLYPDMMLAWYKNSPWTAKVWAYSSAADGVRELNIQFPGDRFEVKAGEKAAYVLANTGNSSKDYVYVFNGLIGEWKEPLEVRAALDYMLGAKGHTGIYLNKTLELYGYQEWKAYGYSALLDEWDIIDFKSKIIDSLYVSDFCALLAYDHHLNTTTKYFQAFNAAEGKWAFDQISMPHTKWSGISVNGRIMMITEDGTLNVNYVKAHAFSAILDRWSTTDFDHSYNLEGYSTTPTSAFAWDDKRFKVIFSTDIDWDFRPGQLEELHVTDYAIAVDMYYEMQTNTHYLYPPKSEIIDAFKFTEGPDIDIRNSWAAEVSWKTNKNADTRLIWGVDDHYEIIEQDTLPEEYTKDHRVLVEGLEANKTYYYGVASLIAGADTLRSDTLSFNTGPDTEAPALADGPHPYRIHDHEASVWWTCNEPSTPIIQWGLSSDYTDSLMFNDAEPALSNAVRLYDLIRDTTYHYRIGGYDRYGNGPFYSADYTFRTHNELPAVTNLAQADSLLWGAAYMTWEPPRIDSSFSEEQFTYGIPVDWKIYNRGDSQKGSTWRSGYLGNNPIAYCPYGSQGEYQQEWLISNPITIDGTTGGVLNFWHMGFYNDYDNAPNKVMVSWTGSDPSDFTTLWSSQDLPDNWSLVQIDLNYGANYGKTMYIAFVYESTYGEYWVIDNVYMDFTLDGYYENFNDLTGWTNAGGRWGLKGEYNNYSLGVDGIKEAVNLPDPIENWDAWEISPSIQITESHHILGFWQMGWGGEYDTKPNEIRVVHSGSSIEANSELVRTVYPVPNGWMWTTVDLSAYIGQSIMIGFRYNSSVGWWWDGSDWQAFWGEDWYIDDMYLFENAPAMVEDPNAKPNEKPLKFASSPNGIAIDPGQFKTVRQVQTPPEDLSSKAPGGSLDLPKEKPLMAVKLPEIKSDPAPSVLAEPKPELYGYEVYGRYPDETHFSYLGYVTSPSFVDWGTYLGYECEYYVEAVYDKDNSQPSNKAMIKGGAKYAANEYGYDTGILYYAYWWYPGCSMANQFYFGTDSVMNVEKIKVHIAKPGSFTLSMTVFDHDVFYDYIIGDNIYAAEEGWYTIDVPASLDIPSSNEITVEFLPQDTLIQLSYEPADAEVSWIYDGSGWSSTSDIFYIRLIGEKLPYVSVSDIPSEFKLSQNYPNPFNPTTTIAFELPEMVKTSVKIYDIRGALVRTLAEGPHEAGYYRVVWDGKDNNGNQAASGLYLIRMEAGTFSEGRKMLLVR